MPFPQEMGLGQASVWIGSLWKTGFCLPCSLMGKAEPSRLRCNERQNGSETGPPETQGKEWCPRLGQARGSRQVIRPVLLAADRPEKSLGMIPGWEPCLGGAAGVPGQGGDPRIL